MLAAGSTVKTGIRSKARRGSLRGEELGYGAGDIAANLRQASMLDLASPSGNGSGSSDPEANDNAGSVGTDRSRKRSKSLQGMGHADAMEKAMEIRKKKKRKKDKDLTMLTSLPASLKLLTSTTTSKQIREMDPQQSIFEIKQSSNLSFWTSQWCVLFALAGFLLAIVESELGFLARMYYCDDISESTDDDGNTIVEWANNGRQRYYRKATIPDLVLDNKDTRCFENSFVAWNAAFATPTRALITLSTLGLLAMLYVHHNLRIRTKYLRSSTFAATDSVVPTVLHTSAKWQFLLETFICIGHAPPGINWSLVVTDIGNKELEYPIEILGMLWMSARVYLVLRWVRERTFFFNRSVTVEILTKLTGISLDFRFALKMLMDSMPYKILSYALLSLLLWSAYIARVCDRELEDTLHIYFWDSLWLQTITVATIGFGDVFPKTHCSRFASGVAMTGGVVLTALMVTLFSNQIQFTTLEYRLFNLVTQKNWKSKVEIAAAKCLQQFYRRKKRIADAGLPSTSTKAKSDFRLAADDPTVRQWHTVRMGYKRFVSRQPHLGDVVDDTSAVVKSIKGNVSAADKTLMNNSKRIEALEKQIGALHEDVKELSSLLRVIGRSLSSASGAPAKQ